MATVNEYDPGDVVRVTAAFTVGGTATDPTAVTFRLREPDGTATEYVYGTDAELEKPSTGNYRVDWPVDQEGWHYFSFTGTGDAPAMEQGEFYSRQDKTS